MTENEAIKEFEQNIQLPFGSSISDEASKTAIKAIEKQEKIKEAFKKWEIDSCGIYGADDETTHLISTLKKILRSDEQ